MHVKHRKYGDTNKLGDILEQSKSPLLLPLMP